MSTPIFVIVEQVKAPICQFVLQEMTPSTHHNKMRQYTLCHPY